MLISCPKCKSVYEISSDVIPAEGRHFSCAECNEVFFCKPEDAMIEQFMDMENVVPEYTKKQAYEVLNKQEKTIRKSIKLNVILSICLAFFVLLTLVFLRFEMTRYLPFMEKIYSSFGLESIYRGRHLEFLNINRREYVENNVSKIEITGEIYNTEKYTVLVPNINLQIVDKNGKIVLSENHPIDLNRLDGGNTLSFKIITVNPTPYAKSVYLTFSEK